MEKIYIFFSNISKNCHHHSNQKIHTYTHTHARVHLGKHFQWIFTVFIVFEAVKDFRDHAVLALF